MVSWQEFFQIEKQKPYFQSATDFVAAERKAGKVVYPEEDLVFSALDMTPLEKVRVIILGQDPYHGLGQAHGLAFSVLSGVQIPPSLRNIFKEIKDDIGGDVPVSGCLNSWAGQGVLLLNTVLTVEAGRPASHVGIGWEEFTDQVIAVLNDTKKDLVFLLWGAHAQKKGKHINRDKHLVLEAPHPSPLSAHRGFFGCGHFSKTNTWLMERSLEPIDWSL